MYVTFFNISCFYYFFNLIFGFKLVILIHFFFVNGKIKLTYLLTYLVSGFVLRYSNKNYKDSNKLLSEFIHFHFWNINLVWYKSYIKAIQVRKYTQNKCIIYWSTEAGHKLNKKKCSWKKCAKRLFKSRGLVTVIKVHLKRFIFFYFQ